MGRANFHRSDTLQALRQCAAYRMDRRLYSYMHQRLLQPDALDALSQLVFNRLLAIPERRLAVAPLRSVLAIAARALLTMPPSAVSTPDSASPARSASGGSYGPGAGDDAHLTQYLHTALSRLPALHAAVLVARTGDGLSREKSAAELDVPLSLVDVYDSQARALLRCATWNR